MADQSDDPSDHNSRSLPPGRALRLACLAGLGICAFGAIAHAAGLRLPAASWLLGVMWLLAGVCTALAVWGHLQWRAAQLAHLREHERQTRTQDFVQDIIDVMPSPVFIKDQSGHYRIVNEAFCAQRGAAREAIVGRTARDLCGNTEIAQGVSEEDASVLSGRPVLKEEVYHHPASGEQRHRIISKGLCHNEHGAPMIVGTHIDVTAWRQAEHGWQDALFAQSRLHAFLQSIFDALPNPLFVKDQAGRYIMTNHAHIASVGANQASDVLGKCAADFAPADVAAMVKETEQRMFAENDGTIHECEVTLYNPAGRARRIIIRKVVSHSPDGQRVIIGLNTDVTALRQAEARWQFALESSGDGIWDWDVNRDRVHYSARWQSMLGFYELPDEPIDAWAMRIHPEDLAATMEALQTHLDGYAPVFCCEHRLQDRDGGFIWVMNRGRIIERDAAGHPARVVGTVSDISARKELEHALRTQHHAIRRVAANEPLTVDAAPAAPAALPILREDDVSHLGDYFGSLGNNSDQLMRLLDDLLKLSSDGDTNRTLRRPLDLQQVFDEAAREFEAWLDSREIFLQQQAGTQETRVLGDADRIGQVVRNLLSNAIKHSPHGSQISVALRDAQIGEQAAIALVVADHGPGIPSDRLDALFTALNPDSAAANEKGRGIGLAICHEIVCAHGGTLSARNRTEGGAEFTMQLPRAA